MDDGPRGVAQPLAGGMRTMLYVASGLVFAVGITLFLLTEQTERYFAWTIDVALTGKDLDARGYVDLTLAAMKAFGGEAEQLDEMTWRVQPSRTRRA